VRRVLIATSVGVLLGLMSLTGGGLQASEPRPPHAGIATAHPLATLAGHEVLYKGGNAFDAAVAVSATLAVVEPYSSGLGGGGFFLIHRQRDGYQTMVDARERAPLAATANMYLDTNGTPVPRLSLDGPRAAAIPGLPAALVYLARRYGRLPLSQSLAPAIRYAREGFPVGPRCRRLARLRLAALRANPPAAGVFLDRGEVPREGFILRQAALAKTLKRLARSGRAGFYDGITARRLVKAARRHGGIWRRQDLQQYRIIERRPVVGRYRGWRIVSAAPPSSGGIVLVQMLNMLKARPLTGLGPVRRRHVLVEVMRRAHRDRARYLGDSDYVHIDRARLLSLGYARRQARSIRLDRASRSRSLGAAVTPARQRGRDTSHFSIIDREGNRVAATLSINTPFGAAFVAHGTGVLLNNEMDDFAIKPGVPNVYGLVGSRANAIAPGKRPLSSMTPVFLEGPAGQVVVLGTPGGSRIITMVLLATLEAVHGRGSAAAWVALPRFHHQYLPDRITYEADAFSPVVKRGLIALGHRLQVLSRRYGNMHIVIWDPRRRLTEAVSDPRGEGLAVVGH